MARKHTPSVTDQWAPPHTGSIRSTLQFFIDRSVRGVVIALCAAFVALLLANSALAGPFKALLQTNVAITVGAFELGAPVLRWINEGLMALFCFVLALGLRSQLSMGYLVKVPTTRLVIAAAIGGMVVPAAIYAGLNINRLGASGWAIPLATDIGLVLGFLALFGNRVPFSLKLVLITVALIDDLVAVLVIAAFYSSAINTGALGLGLLLLALLLFAKEYGVQRMGVFVIGGMLMWLAFFVSGVHATLAGVLLAWAIPAADPGDDSPSTLHTLVDGVQPWVAAIVVPVFVLANATVPLLPLHSRAELVLVELGISLAFIVGKPVGVLGACWLAVRTGIAGLPLGVRWGQMLGMSCLTGCGFTVSLLAASAAFPDGALLDAARLNMLRAAVISGGLGCVILECAVSSDDSETLHDEAIN